jgi:hypothetical protein
MLLLVAKRGKHSDSVDTLVRQRIDAHGPGWVVTPQDFADLGSRDAVATALRRHKAAGTLRLLGRGLYDVPRQHAMFGAVWPEIDAVAKALERKDGIRLQPTGVYAANLLGLSEQVPAQVVFLTDGATRTVSVGPTKITLKRTAPRHMAAAGRLSGLVIQALRSFGQAHVSGQHVLRLRERIPPQERAELLNDIALAPAWMQPILRDVARP